MAEYTSPGILVFIGRARGESVRTDLDLAASDARGDILEIRFPPDVMSVNSSFFLGMFADSIRELGEHEFRAHYIFSPAHIQDTVDDGIRTALRFGSPLPRAKK